MDSYSNLMKTIIKSKSAKRILSYISPIYGNAPHGLSIIQAIGQELDEAAQFCEILENEIFPQTACKMLNYYEAEYGLPTNSDKTTTERQNAILIKIRTRAPITPAKLALLIQQKSGFHAQVIENTAPYSFQIFIVLSEMESGSHASEIRPFVDSVKPAHLNYELFVKAPGAAVKQPCQCSLHQVSVQTAIRESQNQKISVLVSVKQTIQETFSTALIYHNLYLLDGSVSLDGSHKLDAAKDQHIDLNNAF